MRQCAAAEPGAAAVGAGPADDIEAAEAERSRIWPRRPPPDPPAPHCERIGAHLHAGLYRAPVTGIVDKRVGWPRVSDTKQTNTAASTVSIPIAIACGYCNQL